MYSPSANGLPSKKITPAALVKHALIPVVHKFENFADPMVHIL
jgi:hypothetical protein